ncbi:MAG TPA: DUF790 family protein [Polyangiaceae bacterium]
MLRASAHLEGERIVPHYFTAGDQPWLRALLDEYRRFVGRKCAELHERLREPLSTRAPKTKLRIAIVVLDALCRSRPPAAASPKEVRAALFRAAAASHVARAAVLSAVAGSFALTESQLESALFADLPGERRVAELPPALSVARIITDANLAIVTSLLRRAAHVRIVVRGDYRALIRHARVAGLICRQSRVEHGAQGVALDVSGPFALFHHCDLYGRALGSLIPRLASSGEFDLTATCALGRDNLPGSLVLRSGELWHSPEPSLASPDIADDAQLERKFERAFRRAAPDWDLIREPGAIASGERLIFPAFALVPRRDPNQSWLLEIVGFWTPDYLREKLQRLSAAGIERFVLCVDQNRECADAELPPDPRIIPHQARIDARAVLTLVTAERAGHSYRGASFPDSF